MSCSETTKGTRLRPKVKSCTHSDWLVLWRHGACRRPTSTSAFKMMTAPGREEEVDLGGEIKCCRRAPECVQKHWQELLSQHCFLLFWASIRLRGVCPETGIVFVPQWDKKKKTSFTLSCFAGRSAKRVWDSPLLAIVSQGSKARLILLLSGAQVLVLYVL